jgi:3-oxoacyl-[acyl-carrier protein] reductase
MSNWGDSKGSVKVDEEIDWVRRDTPPGRRFEDQVVVVTGASRGFGRLIALSIAEEGGHVVINYVHSKDKANAVVAEVEKLGRRAIAVQADIGNLDQVKAMADKVWEEFGRCDVLINNAGETAPTKMSWRDLDLAIIDETFDIDVKGTMFCTHVFGERMLDEQKSGNIVSIGSNVVTTGSPRAPEYAAAKYAILGLTKSYALAFAPYVRVNCAAPGYMDTDSLNSREDWTPERRAFVAKAAPLKAIGKPANLVRMVLFMASDDAIFMTGNTIISDGGFSMPGA